MKSKPPEFISRGQPMLFPELPAMEPGDHLDIPLVGKQNARLVRNCIQFLKRSRGMDFVTKTLSDKRAIRVWRTK